MGLGRIVSYMLNLIFSPYILDIASQFSTSMTGGWSGGAIKSFWNHCFQQEEWYEHPAKYLNINRERHSNARSSMP